MPEKQMVICPFCGAKQEETIPKGTKWGFAHPVDGDWRAKVGEKWVINPPEQCPWWKRIWYKCVYGQHKRTRQKIIAKMAECKKCNRRFHLEFFEKARNNDDVWWIYFGDPKDEPPRLIIDRLLDSLPVPYVLTSLMMGLLLWTPWFIIISIFDGWNKIGYEWVSWVFSCIIFIITLIAIKSHADRIRNLPSEVGHIPDLQPWMRKYIVRGWIKHTLGDIGAKIKAPDFFGLCSAIIYIAYAVIFFLFCPAALNFVFESPSIAHYAEFVIATVIWALFYFILGTSVYLGLSLVWLMRRIGSKDIQVRINPLDRHGGLAPFGRLALSAVLSLTPALLLGSFSVWFALILNQQSVSVILQIALLLLGIGITAVVFFTALHSIHRVMKEVKKQYTTRILEAWDNEFEGLIDKVGEMKIPSEDLSVVTQLSNTYKDIAQMHEWPFEFGTVVKLLLSIISQLIIPVLAIVAAIILDVPISLI